MADGSIFILENINFEDLITKDCKEMRNTHINIGTGTEISIKDLAQMIKDIVGFKGDLFFNIEKPDGTMRKLTDVTKLHDLGWEHKVNIKGGVKRLYDWYLN